MPDLQTLSDHHDIRELIVAYSTAIDTRDFDALDAVFTPDAAIDYLAMGGIAGRCVNRAGTPPRTARRTRRTRFPADD
ncbi:nuclear transport factor 2 family protein [Burkholderia cepacia]|uniref:nuclear transport factor 2 family protein n=1 Tax=Burkholderia cepacia TaxID=292 RepID=UPI0021AB5FBD|nr:nuclear transport factor 2 family protein [Burkholderia cepacia]